ncbi:hypothetical protein [Chromobacterium phragmitis]|uniref:Iron-containing redox enzyme family protein n=1 Tax=Chromobacterium phragmitis TaxID=2202141 RepID=A0A344ULT8_9NEIS|nr:hypothetical protein [Chromobacterium phragmitis]AXE36236.1 hypothetical protein DK843_19215 [Chromobacterium phragmitis]
MTDMQENSCTEFYADYVVSAADMSATERATWLYKTRVGNRKDASTLGWLNELLRTGMARLGHIANDMYCDLLDGRMSHEGWSLFLREYYWGSGYGFQRVVLPAAAKGSSNDIWRTYIKSIIYEENMPSSHCDMFKTFMQSIGVEVGDLPGSAAAFNQKMLSGYSGSLGHSMGYALGIETEADFQIALLFVSLRAEYEEQVEHTEFFRIHMSESGEELHAQETCASIEQLLDQGLCTEAEIKQGFRQAIVDTRDYMLAIRASVRASNVAAIA